MSESKFARTNWIRSMPSRNEAAVGSCRPRLADKRLNQQGVIGEERNRGYRELLAAIRHPRRHRRVITVLVVPNVLVETTCRMLNPQVQSGGMMKKSPDGKSTRLVVETTFVVRVPAWLVGLAKILVTVVDDQGVGELLRRQIREKVAESILIVGRSRGAGRIGRINQRRLTNTGEKRPDAVGVE